MATEDMSMLSDDAFARLVAEDVKGRASEDQRQYLRLPENWERWRKALLALLGNLDAQIAELDERDERARERFEPLGEEGTKLLTETLLNNEEKRKRITRFRFHVEKRLGEVDRMIALGAEEVSEDVKLIEFLRTAIARHKEMILQYELDYSAVDEALWAALDGQWLFNDIEADSLV